MKPITTIYSVLILIVYINESASLAHTRLNSTTRAGRLLSPWNFVRFPNDACSISGGMNMNGTCYTQAECAARNGKANDPCAGGYGVCCSFSISCGETRSENLTFFQSPVGTSMASLSINSCRAKICPLNTNICQLRLDFVTFSISAPSTVVASVGLLSNGRLIPANANPTIPSTILHLGNKVTSASQCSTDSFAVTNPNGPAPPAICGFNTGEHLYVDASQNCNDLVFSLSGQTPRQWSIKVSQYSCDYSNLAPSGCTQYFFGGTGSGLARSYNYRNPNANEQQHLANQKQVICVRREQGNCKICWDGSSGSGADFAVSGMGANPPPAIGYNMGQQCCGYGDRGVFSNGVSPYVTTNQAVGFDCVSIPGARDAASALVPPRLCGRGAGLKTPSAANAKICSMQQPFTLNFFSDNFEFTDEVGSSTPFLNRGFELKYEQIKCP